MHKFLRPIYLLLFCLPAIGLRAENYYVICSNQNYSGGSSTSYTVGPKRVRSYTDMVYPGAVAPTYSTQSWTLQGYYRDGEWVDQNGNRAPFSHNSRAEVMTPPDVCGGHARDSVLVVVGMNCEYFLVKNLGSGSMGPSSTAQQTAQFKKISQAMVRMDADIYGMCEIEQGPEVLEKCAQYLTQQLGRNFSYIKDGLTANGTYTKSGILYCSDRVSPVGLLVKDDKGVQHRKVMQGFEINAGRPGAGERFIYSINHFKAKGSGGQGGDADQGDGQGGYNASRVAEAQSVLDYYYGYTSSVEDKDLLVMGDLNSYAKEDPIRVFTNAGFTDLHRAFHADSSYSYVYWGGTAGYLDHALANAYLRKQVVGMEAWHVNSDENDRFTYNGSLNSRLSDEEAMFRYSDHDPVMVGLLLDKRLSTEQKASNSLKNLRVYTQGNQLVIQEAKNSQLQLVDPWGHPVYEETIGSDNYVHNISDLPSGIYIANVYRASATDARAFKSLKFVKTSK